ncbi:MAG: hypothetical protein RLZZ618_3616 [Pseudomonadota bacterium]
MWPREQRVSEVLRIGALAAERWAETPARRGWSSQGGLALVSRHEFAANERLSPEVLGAAVLALLSHGSKPSGVTVVIESAWMPLMLVDTGGALWSLSQVEHLVRHQMMALYADGLTTAQRWELRVAHRIGDRHALGHALAPEVKQALMAAAAQADVRFTAMLPAWSWGWARFARARRAAAWWLWPEQDRSLLSRIEARQLVGLHTGLPVLADAEGVHQAVSAESARLGVPADPAAVMGATWLPQPPPGGQLPNAPTGWVSMAAPSVDTAVSPKAVPRAEVAP